MNDWDRFNDQFRESDEERAERQAARRKKRAAETAQGIVLPAIPEGWTRGGEDIRQAYPKLAAAVETIKR